jgi:cytochrome P450
MSGGDVSASTVTIDLEDPGLVADPYPHFAEWRAAGQAVYHEGLGMHLACTYADANAVLRSKSLGRIWVDRQPDDMWHVFNWLHSDSILESEPPKHTRLKSLVSQAFTRGRVEALRPTVERLADELLDAAASKQEQTGAFDLIADYAEPLPVAVIAELLGVPADRRADLRRWSQDIVRMYDYRRTAEDEARARASAAEFAALVEGVAVERRRSPRDDLISHLARAEAEGERLSERELVATAVLLLNAGHEASVNGFGNGLVALFDHPDAHAALVADPYALAPTAVEEMLRYDSPLHLFERTATAEVEVAGVRLQPGQKIADLLGSANRDPAAFADADAFDLTRDPNPHIAFGAGIHFCLGAPLARLELTVTVPRLFTRFPDLRPAAPPVRRDTFVLRGYHEVPVAG